MAIRFARCEFIRRSQGSSAPRVAAYNARELMVNDRTGEIHDAARWAEDLAHHEVRLPVGGAAQFENASFLANAVEAHARRINSQTGRDFLFALDVQSTPAERLAMIRSFVDEHFVSKGLPAQLDIHLPHEGSLNHHAHVWVPMYRLEGDHFAATQARDLLPAIRNSPYGSFVSEADRWGQLWAIHQNRWFYEHRIDRRVDPIAIVPETRSYGPRRSWGPDPEHSRVAEIIAKHRAIAAERARDAMAVFEHLRKQPTGFNIRDLSAFVAKHVADPKERAEVYTKAENAWFDHLVRDLWADRGTVRHASGVRHLQVEDIARQMAPRLPALEAEARRLQERQRRAAYGMKKRQQDFSEANRQIEKIGMLRKAWHRVREDHEIHMLYGWRRGQKAAFTHLATREKEYADRLKPLTEAISAEWARVGSKAEAELRRLQKLSANAQRELDKIRVDPHLGTGKMAVLAGLSEQELHRLTSADQLHALVNERVAAHDQRLVDEINTLRVETARAEQIRRMKI